MVQFIAINPHAEVNSQTIASFAYAMKRGINERISILEKYNIYIDKADWFPLQQWLNAFADLSDKLGEMNLFLIGSNIIRHALFPPINNLKQALESLNIAYHMNHRIDGKILYDKNTNTIFEGIGDYILLSYDEEKAQAIMKCTNPYPSKFDEGIIHQLVELYKPNKENIHTVKLDTKLPHKNIGADSCTYIIQW